LTGGSCGGYRVRMLGDEHVKPSDKGPRKPYEKPRLVELGSLHEVTLESHKVGAHCDVTCFHHGSG